MSRMPLVYREVKLSPTTTTTYLISTFTDTVLSSIDDYTIICEAGCSLTQKSSTGFQISVAFSSPINPATAWLQFHVSGI